MCHMAGMNAREKRSLRAVHTSLLEAIDLDQSEVIHHLRQDDVISSGEYDDILAQPDRRRKTIKMLYLLNKRGADRQPYGNFRKALLRDYPHLVELLDATYAGLSEISAEEEIICMHCFVLNNIIAADVSHSLYGSGVLSDDEYMTINEAGTYNKTNVERLLKALSRFSDGNKARECLMDALHDKYKHVLEQVKGRPIDELVLCTCKTDSNQAVGFPGQQSVALTTCGLDKDLLKDKRRTKQCHCRHRRKHGSDKFTNRREKTSRSNVVPQLGEVFDEPLSVADQIIKRADKRDTTLQSNTELVKRVGYFEAGPEELLLQCKELWDELFIIRERGDWARHAERTAQALAYHHDNDDIKLLLYRSEMCVAAFYHRDVERAETMYDKARALLPRTRMPAWHAARLISLEVARLIEQKRLCEAEQCIQEAKVAMQGLAPCMSTGAVYFFEGLYLWGLLKCRRNSHVAVQLSEQIRLCFCTAIYHYEQESIFDITSFLNQVYLFMALCALHVDITSKTLAARYAEFGAPSQENLTCAEQALHRFRNSGWGERTEWSEMLYHIGRAELCRYQSSTNSVHDSLESYKAALHLAIAGEFKVHEEFIKLSIAKLSGQDNHRVTPPVRLPSESSGAEPEMEDSDAVT